MRLEGCRIENHKGFLTTPGGTRARCEAVGGAEEPVDYLHQEEGRSDGAQHEPLSAINFDTTVIRF